MTVEEWNILTLTHTEKKNKKKNHNSFSDDLIVKSKTIKILQENVITLIILIKEDKSTNY